MEGNRFGIKKFDYRSFNIIYINYIYVYQYSNNNIITYRIIDRNTFGIMIDKIYGRK